MRVRWVVDSDGFVLDVGARIVDALGYRPDELIGGTGLHLVEDVNWWMEHVEPAVTGLGRGTAYANIVRADGLVLPDCRMDFRVLASGTRLFDVRYPKRAFQSNSRPGKQAALRVLKPCNSIDYGLLADESRGSNQRVMSLSEAIDAWERHDAAAGTRNIKRAASVVRRAAKLSGWSDCAHLTHDSIRIYLDGRLAGTLGEQIGPKTHDNHLSYLRRFCSWLVERRQIPVDPTAELKALGKAAYGDAEGVGRYMIDEVYRMIDAARSDELRSKPRFGAVRSPLYALLFWGGLRYMEAIKALRRDFELDDPERAYMTIRATNSKNRRTDLIPLRSDAALLLLEHFGSLNPDERLWPGKVHERVLEADMELAEVPRVGAEGLNRSWHSFRKGRATHLAEQGVHPKIAAKLLRHSDPKVTLAIYTRAEAESIREAINRGEIPEGLSLDNRGRGRYVRDGDPMNTTPATILTDGNPGLRGPSVRPCSSDRRLNDSADGLAPDSLPRLGESRDQASGSNGEGGTRTPPRESTREPVPGRHQAERGNPDQDDVPARVTVEVTPGGVVRVQVDHREHRHEPPHHTEDRRDRAAQG